jgi:hypothetical protein
VIFTLTSSAYESLGNHPLSATHLATRWEMDVLGGDFSAPLWDSGWDAVHLLSITTPDFAPAAYQFRAAWMDGLELEGVWSDPAVVGTPDRTLERAWAFNLDGHIFYVMSFVSQPAMVYDTVAQQWYSWFTKDATAFPTFSPYWNMFRGIVWQGRTLAADFSSAKIWEVDPHSLLDEETKPVQRAVTGFLPLRGSQSVRQGSLRITARKEDAAQPATISMRFSDDNGKTWSASRTVLLASSSYSQRLEFRSLGRVRAPGRLWEISDEGGFVNIYGADADMEGEE